MNTQEILNEIGKLPFLEKQRLIETLTRNGTEPPVPASPITRSEPISEDEIEQILRAEGVITFADPSDYTEEDEDFEPIEVEGEPLSEQIIRERS